MRALCWLLFVTLFALSGCSSPPALTVGPAPWADGESNLYVALTGRQKPEATVQWTWSRADSNGWSLSYERNNGGATKPTLIKTDDSLWPVQSVRESNGTKTTTSFSPQQVVIDTETAGKKSSHPLTPRQRPIDNDLLLQLLRAAPLGDGYAASVYNVVPGNRAGMPTTIQVLGTETVTVPAGEFSTWHLRLQAVSGRHDAWYEKAPPHRLVRYVNGAGISQLQLQAYRSSAQAPWQGQSTPPALVAPGSEPVRWTVVVANVLSFAVMIGLPILLGLVAKRRLHVGWKLFGAGALTFVASQVVHLPLNAATGLLGGRAPLGDLPLVWLALAAGLSAGLCEELARYVALRFAMRRPPKTWEAAIQFGAGHGGIESMLLGLLAGISFAALLALKYYPLTSLGVDADTAMQIARASDTYWTAPWYSSLVGALERVFAISAHVGMTVLVMRSVAARKPVYLLAAIAAHTVLDAYAVWANSTKGTLWAEFGVAVMAAALIGSALLLRKHWTLPASSTAPTSA